MKSLHVLCLLLLPSLAWSQPTTECRPGENCEPPDCRCWDDMSIPGDIPVAQTPQVILVTFEYAINEANADFYTQLFGDTVNPNNCPAVGTFFVQETNSDLGLIKTLSDNGHEIGVTSIDGTVPQTEEEWVNHITQVRSELVAVGVAEDRILGVRAPQLQPGGQNEFNALDQEGFLYDASCTTSSFDEESSLLWPYTYDFAPGPACDNGESPEQQVNGTWQVMVADLEFNGTKCATPSACTQVASQRDAFDLFYNSFVKHYDGRRTPFMIVINPDWVTVDSKRTGTRQFIEYVRAAFEDTWILTVTQALEWVRNPVNNANATTDYPPWACN